MSALTVASARAVRLPRISREAVGVAAVVAIFVGGPVGIALATGAFGVPHVDDWAFYRIADSLEHTGRLHLIGWNEMTLVGHLVWGVPFIAVLGDSVAATHWAGTVASVLALVGAYALYRRFLSRDLALFGLAVLGAVPILAMLSISYMTDVTSLAAQLGCLAIGVASLQAPPSRRGPLLAAALLVGFFGFTIREVALAAPLGVLAGHATAAQRDRRSIAPLALGAAGFAAACAAFYLWRSGLAGGTRVSGGGSSREALGLSASLYFTLAFMALPALVAAWRTLARELRNPVVLSVVAATAALGIEKFARHGERGILIGNYVDRTPMGFQAGTPPPIVPDAAWRALVVIAIVAGACLAGLLARRVWQAVSGVRQGGLAAIQPSDSAVAIFSLLAAVFMVVRARTGGPVFDRYLLPLVPVVILAVLSGPPPGRGLRAARPAGAGVLAALAAFWLVTLLYVSDLDTREAVRWHAGERLVAQGFDARDVDAGFEWMGLHANGAARHVDNTKASHVLANPFAGSFPRARSCAIVSASPISVPGVRPLGAVRYQTVPGVKRMWLYRNDRGCSRARVRGP